MEFVKYVLSLLTTIHFHKSYSGPTGMNPCNKFTIQTVNCKQFSVLLMNSHNSEHYHHRGEYSIYVCYHLALV